MHLDTFNTIDDQSTVGETKRDSDSYEKST